LIRLSSLLTNNLEFIRLFWMEIVKEEIIKQIMLDPLLFCKFNPAQKRAIDIIGKGSPINIITFGNGTGKTHLLISLWSAIMFGTKNGNFNGSIYKDWKYPKTARLCAPESLLDDNGAIQRLMKKLFPAGKYNQQKNRRAYYSSGSTSTGWTWDVMTYNQDVEQAAGETKGLILYSEPPPYPLFTENIARLRAGGIIILEMTPLFSCAWIKDEYIDARTLKNDKGEVIGNIEHITGDIWENCIENGGQLSRQAIEIMLSQYNDEERELREKGIFGQLAGKIYKKYGRANLIDSIPEYHRVEWEKKEWKLYNVIDPHDRKPFAIGWYALFKNGDIIVIDEWPDNTMIPFHKLKDSNLLIDDYVQLIITKEKQMGKVADIRIIDPNFGNSPAYNTITTVKQDLYNAGKKVNYSLVYQDAPDSIETGHLQVKDYIGDSEKNIRPKLYVLSNCHNHDFGLSHYCWKEKKDIMRGGEDKPDLLYKDFPDLVRYLIASKPRYSEALKPQVLWTPRTIGNYRGV